MEAPREAFGNQIGKQFGKLICKHSRNHQEGLLGSPYASSLGNPYGSIREPGWEALKQAHWEAFNETIAEPIGKPIE